MERPTLMEISENLCSSEVAALCFLCRDVLNKTHLEGVKDAKVLFNRLEEKDCLNIEFIKQLLQTIRRIDLLNLVKIKTQDVEETDANPFGKLSNYRVMLYRIYDETTEETVKMVKFLLQNTIGRRQLEECNTVLDIFIEMEKVDLLSQSNLHKLHLILKEVDMQLALTVQQFEKAASAEASNGFQNGVSPSETQFTGGQFSSDKDADIQLLLHSDQTEYYAMDHIPHGLCVIINNEEFLELTRRGGSDKDTEALRSLFDEFGFDVKVFPNLTAEQMKNELSTIATRNFSMEDALVVCVLSHGENGCVFGIDSEKVYLQELTKPFTSKLAPTLAGKPKLFFIQACQGRAYQTGSLPLPSNPNEANDVRQNQVEEDAGRIVHETVASDADFLLGMSTVQNCKSFRKPATGSIYIQELCKQLRQSAESCSQRKEDILSVLTRVNREVSKGNYHKYNYKQMPEPKYTLTKTLILKFAGAQVKQS
ncbi:caspase-8 isoform X1 [Syngnathus acus]|uniref:caspase-8 isoform X1 n=1 Tax=Syngnathus acus TaxID=161584 RepID=UPI001885F003|nr:caspase-8 isoform X1 [Syngnathus acus]